MLIALICCAIIVHYGLRQGVHKHNIDPITVAWLQSDSIDQNVSALVAKKWQFDYIEIEKILLKSKVNTPIALVINADMLELLERSYAYLSPDLESSDLQRLSLLIEKTIPNQNGKQLTHLLKQYYFYHQDYQVSLLAINQSQSEQQYQLLTAAQSDNKQRQIRYFGSQVAEKLFHKQNRTTNYLNQRRVINLDPALSDAERRQKLAELQADFKRSKDE